MWGSYSAQRSSTLSEIGHWHPGYSTQVSQHRRCTFRSSEAYQGSDSGDAWRSEKIRKQFCLGRSWPRETKEESCQQKIVDKWILHLGNSYGGRKIHQPHNNEWSVLLMNNDQFFRGLPTMWLCCIMNVGQGRDGFNCYWRISSTVWSTAGIVTFSVMSSSRPKHVERNCSRMRKLYIFCCALGVNSTNSVVCYGCFQ